MDRAVLGVDIGTGSAKAVLVGLDGALLAEETWRHAVSRPAPGQFEHDADKVWWSGLVTVVRRLLAAAPHIQVEAIGLSACGPCVVPIDEAGRALRPGILYGVDTRATRQVAEAEARIGARAVADLYGMPLTSQSIGPKIDWLAENEPQVYERTSRLLTANGYLGYRLTGGHFVDHHQAAYFQPYYRDHDWDGTFDRSEVRSRLPELVWSDQVIGTVHAGASAETGLAEGLPVVLGSSDGLTGAYGAGGRPGVPVLNYGTTLGLTVLSSGRTGHRTGGLWRTPGAFAGELCTVGALSTSGALTEWFLEVFGKDVQASAPDRATAFERLEAEARLSPADGTGPLVLPYFAGERTPIYDPGAKGVILGLTLEHTRGDLYRAVLEGTAYAVRHLVEEMGAMGVDVPVLRVVGGGTSSRLWLQIVSDVTGIPQQVVSPQLGAPLGAAFLAAAGCGLAAGPDAVEHWTGSGSSYAPDPGAQAIHEVRYAAFRSAYTTTRPLLDALGETA